ncbi:hypothetical protein PIB30_033673 [Stylosanthes scabra]|uniref:Uncharacterized protein n=1 Tax=Stylosanthes scabra TaxID=79078 RepID=A0ABU6UFX7_9FABA|nr:hypothetical protein [Stylosanthes scabra]
MEEQDPFHFLFRFSEISPSQEQLLRQRAFKGEESANSRDEALPPPSSALFETESAGVFISSLPETQSPGVFDARGSTQEQDVFHTPPEKSSVPSSGEKPPDHCTVNQELDAFNDSLEFVDFGDSQGAGFDNLDWDSDLGFSEVQLTQRDKREWISQSPRGIKRDGVDEVTDEFQVKKSKILDPQSGSDFSRVCLGIDSLETQQSNGNCKGVVDVEPLQVCGANEIPMQENEGDELMCGEEGQNMENSVHELEFPGEEKVQKKNKSSTVFQVLRFLAEEEVQKLSSNNKEAGGAGADDDDIENAGFLDVVKIGGVDLPHPRWWRPEDDNNNKVLSQ